MFLLIDSNPDVPCTSTGLSAQTGTADEEQTLLTEKVILSSDVRPAADTVTVIEIPDDGVKSASGSEKDTESLRVEPESEAVGLTGSSSQQSVVKPQASGSNRSDVGRRNSKSRPSDNSDDVAVPLTKKNSMPLDDA